MQSTSTPGANEGETKPIGEETKTPATPRTIQPLHREGVFLLYLRPFSTTGQLNSGNPEYATGPMTPRAYTQPKSVEFETRLATAVESFGPLIAFGKPGEHFGAGRIHATEDEWREDFMKLANRAWAIFVLPFNAPSTQWEIEWLISEGLIPKCIFVMPPQPTGDFQAVSKMWSEAREVLLNKGLPLPPYSADGALFRIGQKGEFNGIQQSSIRHLRRQVLDLLQAGAERNSHTGRIVLYVLGTIAVLFVIVWLSVDRAPVSVAPGTPYGSPGPVRQEQLATNLPDGGGVTGGHYFCPKWKLAYDMPADWKIKSVAIAERWRASVQDPEANAKDISSESHALLFIVSPTEEANLTVASKKLPFVKATAEAITDLDRRAAIEMGLSPVGPISELKIDGQSHSRAKYLTASVYTIEQNTVCQGYLLSFIIAGRSEAEVDEAVSSLQSLRIHGCKPGS